MAESALAFILAFAMIAVGFSMISTNRKIVKNDSSNLRELLPIWEIRRGYKQAKKEFKYE